MAMPTDIDPKRVEKLREQLAGEPEFAAVINALWYQSIDERIAELPPDQRHQAWDHWEAVIDLLRGEDDEANE
jgi:hypothetical protein